MQIAQLQKTQLVGQIAGGIAHDFRNLLTVILGSGELLRDLIAEHHPGRAELDAIMEAGGRATALTSQLLGFSKHATGVAVDLDLSALLADMGVMLARMAGEDVRIRTQIDAPLGRIHADPVQIEQVIANLIVNARDSMPGGGTIRVQVRDVLVPGDAGAPPQLAPGAYCRLRVSDTGCGMSAETLRQAATFHFTTKDARGTGLGLATCERIVTQFGGALAIESVLDEGTQVAVYLPRVEALRAPSAVAPAAPAPPRGTETVLVVEDDDTVRTLLKRTLEGLGYEVHVAASGGEALSVHAEHQDTIDAILCDVIVPDLSGPEIIKRILARAMRVPAVVFMSGHSDHALLRDGVLQTAANFLQKPLMRASIAAKLREAIDAE
jgi:CheY-like chemotaxis protein